MYQALYRKWRPVTFDAVIGQEQVSRVLRYQVANDKLSHAYLFIGSRGTGKTTCARILSRAVNCEAPENGNPCGKCPSCRAILAGSAPEIVEIDAASNNGVDDVRALRDEAIYSPASLKKRVYIIDEVHMLSKSAFNALLKILEEPPSHLLFILATTELNKVPATILSRCQRFNFKRIDQEDIAKYLLYVAKSEKLTLTEQAAMLLARLAEGGMRDALSLLDQCSYSGDITEEHILNTLGLSERGAVAELLQSIISGNTAGALTVFREQWNSGKDPVTVLRELDSMLRDVLLLKTCGRSSELLISGYYAFDTLKKLAGECSVAKVIGMMELIQKHMSDMRDSSNPKLTAELCIVSLSVDTGDEIHMLSARIDGLETKIRSGAYSIAPSNGKPASATSEEPREIIQPASAAEGSPESISRPAENSVKSDMPVLPKASPDIVQPEPSKPDVHPEPPRPEIHPETSGSEIKPKLSLEDILPKNLEEEKPEVDYTPQADEAPEAFIAEQDNESPDWSKIVELIAPAVSRDMKPILSDSGSIYGAVEGNILHLYLHSGFIHTRYSSSPNIQLISDVLSEKLGRHIGVVVSEMEQESRERRDINELRSFSNVQFFE